jgi:hypothetical protein
VQYLDTDFDGIYDDGEWVTWHEINTQLQYKEWAAKYPNAKQSIIPYVENLLSLAESYHRDTGRHLSVYGDIGELFGAITYGIELHSNYAQGSDGRLGNDFVEVKTITPFKKKDVVTVDTNGNFSKLLIVKINQAFQVAGRMVDRDQLPKRDGRYLRVSWDDLSSVA